MSVLVGILLAGILFNIPDEYPLAAQIWDCLPVNMAAIWGAFSENLISLFGRYFTSWQIVPVIYVFLAVLLGILGGRVYTKTNKN